MMNQSKTPEQRKPGTTIAEAALELTARLYSGFLELLFPTPKICLFCESRLLALGICEPCRKKAEERKRHPGQCNRCGTFYQQGVYCQVCYYWPDNYIKNTAPLSYQDDAKEIIHRFKYQYQGYLAGPLALLIFRELCKNPALIRDTHQAIIAPIPMSFRRYLKKGYNHAEVLSKSMSGLLCAEHIPDLLQRRHHHRHQVGLGHQSRRQNLKNAFTIRPHWVNYIQNKEILLVDDVLTTSSTLQEAAKTLLEAGAAKVFSVTIAAGNPEH